MVVCTTGSAEEERAIGNGRVTCSRRVLGGAAGGISRSGGDTSWCTGAAGSTDRGACERAAIGKAGRADAGAALSDSTPTNVATATATVSPTRLELTNGLADVTS